MTVIQTAPPNLQPIRRDGVLYGFEEPRIFTQPLAPLTRKTSLGFKAIEFAEQVLEMELMPWQKWWLIHALEGHYDDAGQFQFRFRTIVTLVARQNGKTTIMIVLSLFFMYMGHARLVLGAAQTLDIAKEAWEGSIEIAEGLPDLRAEIGKVRKTNGEQEFRLTNNARYKIAAATGKAGRGLSVDLLDLDELREQRDWEAWNALSKTTNARPNHLKVCFSNAGDDESIVLNQLRANAMDGKQDTLAIMEWSGEEGCALDDRTAWAQSNPALGYLITEQVIEAALATDPPAGFRTEVLCQRVDQLDGALDLASWRENADHDVDIKNHIDDMVLCIDVGQDGESVTLGSAAVLGSGDRAVVDVLQVWQSTAEFRAELPGIVKAIASVRRDKRPAPIAWFPNGPGAAIAPEMRGLGGIEIKGAELSETCQEFADLVRTGNVIHRNDSLLNAQVAAASKKRSGDTWTFTRRGIGGSVNALYCVAGAVHVARTFVAEKPLPRPMVV